MFRGRLSAFAVTIIDGVLPMMKAWRVVTLRNCPLADCYPDGSCVQGSRNYMGQNNMGQKSGRRGKPSFFHQTIFGKKKTLSMKTMNMVVPVLG